jgi:hypothetical protein
MLASSTVPVLHRGQGPSKTGTMRLSPLAFAAALFAMTMPTSADGGVSPTEVLVMLARVRAPEAAPREPGRYDRGPSARELAAAIARQASSREEAALAVVYAAYESGANAAAVGDGGKSLGAYQLRFVAEEVATDPDASTGVWLTRARAAARICSGEADERLAALVSGRCEAGRAKARRRAAMAHEVAAP